MSIMVDVCVTQAWRTPHALPLVLAAMDLAPVTAILAINCSILVAKFVVVILIMTVVFCNKLFNNDFRY